MVEQRIRAIIALVTYFLIISILGFMGEAGVSQVIIGFLPSLLFVAFMYTTYHALNEKILIIAPWILSILFILFGFLGLPLVAQVEFVILGVVNIILSYLVLILVHETTTPEKKEAKHPHYYTPHVEPPKKSESVSESLQTLVANCKALNHVIGRVYSKAHGGSDMLRQRIRIQPEVYHEIEVNLKHKNYARVSELLDYLKQKVNLFSHQEIAVFGAVKLNGIERDENGTNTVEQVLAKNDNDPVHSYIKGIKDTISSIEKKIKHS